MYSIKALFSYYVLTPTFKLSSFVKFLWSYFSVQFKFLCSVLICSLLCSIVTLLLLCSIKVLVFNSYVQKKLRCKIKFFCFLIRFFYVYSLCSYSYIQIQVLCEVLLLFFCLIQVKFSSNVITYAQLLRSYSFVQFEFFCSILMLLL